MTGRQVRYARNGSVRLAYREFGDGDTTPVWNPGWFSNVDLADEPGSPITARIGAFAGDGEVLASRTVRDLSAGSGLAFESLGAQRFKGLPDEMHIYRLTSQR
jgi:hypothetical protein